MRITYDSATDVAYIELRPLGADEAMGPALFLERDPAFHGFIIADFTEYDGMLVGFEVQMASRCLAPALLSAAERVDGQNAARRLSARVVDNPRFAGRPGRAGRRDGRLN